MGSKCVKRYISDGSDGDSTQSLLSLLSPNQPYPYHSYHSTTTHHIPTLQHPTITTDPYIINIIFL